MPPTVLIGPNGAKGNPPLNLLQKVDAYGHGSFSFPEIRALFEILVALHKTLTWLCALPAAIGDLVTAINSPVTPSASTAVPIWDWAASNAALTGGVMSGIASGGAAYLIFIRGLRSERDKQAALEQNRRSEAAFGAMAKMRDWLEVGLKTGELVEEQLARRKEDILKGLPSPMAVKPFLNSLPEPERISVAEVSFLASRDNAELINRVLEIQSWGHHLLVLASEYSKKRVAFGEWAASNAIEHELIGEDGVSTTFDKRGEVSARMRIAEMEGILSSIQLDFREIESTHKEAIAQFALECRAEYPKSFPSVELRYPQ